MCAHKVVRQQRRILRRAGANLFWIKRQMVVVSCVRENVSRSWCGDERRTSAGCGVNNKQTPRPQPRTCAPHRARKIMAARTRQPPHEAPRRKAIEQDWYQHHCHALDNALQSRKLPAYIYNRLRITNQLTATAFQPPHPHSLKTNTTTPYIPVDRAPKSLIFNNYKTQPTLAPPETTTHTTAGRQASKHSRLKPLTPDT